MNTHAFKAVTFAIFFTVVLHWDQATEAQIKPAEDAPKPLTPQQSAKHIKLPNDLRIEIVASEPLLADPSAITFDEQGRMFVCELHGYNLEGQLDIAELNKTGKLDKKIRRIQASSKAKEAAKAGTYGTVKLLKDTDGDGRMDKAIIWADRIPPCYGLIAARGGIIVVCAPDILFLADTDGDDRADVKIKLFTGFHTGMLERGINNPHWGPDNWIYIAKGHAGGTITGPNLKMPVKLGNTDFRIKADGSAIESITGATGTFGHSFTKFGQRFVNNGATPARYAAPLPHRYLARNPYAAYGDTRATASNYSRVYSRSTPHPWRTKRLADPRWVRFYGAHETSSDHFTAGCGSIIYRADLFPESYHQNYFVCEPSRNVVHRALVSRDGSGVKVRRAPQEQQSEFLASTDKWFRPMNLNVGPDGALYIVDMYREIIEDYSAIPRYLQQQYDVTHGIDRGRIWRILPKDAKYQKPPNLKAAKSAQLVTNLDHPNVWWRDTARRLLIERGDEVAARQLAALVRAGETAPGRMSALYTLSGMGKLAARDVEHALSDESFGVRLHALRLSEPWLDSDPALLKRVLSMVGDPDPWVRLQLAMTLGESKDDAAAKALAQLAVKSGQERWMSSAILSSAHGQAGLLLATLLMEPTPTAGSIRLLRPLAAVIGAKHEDQTTADILFILSSLGGEKAANQQTQTLTGLIEGLKRGKQPPLKAKYSQAAWAILLGSPSNKVRSLALNVSGILKIQDSPQLKAVYTQAVTRAVNAKINTAARLTSIRLLTAAPFVLLEPVARKVLHPSEPIQLQLAIVQALSASDDKRAAGILLSGWSAYTPDLRRAVVTALFTRGDRIPALLDAMEKGKVDPASIPVLQRSQLTGTGDAKTRERALALFAKLNQPAEQNEMVERFAKSLSSKRDVDRGGQLFKQHCAACHKIGNEGFDVGPQLTRVASSPDVTILNNILLPSATITEGFPTYIITTDDGRNLIGAVASESATSITLRQAKGVTQTVLRKNIEKLVHSKLSLMPANFGQLLKPQDAADILGFLRKTFGQMRLDAKVLFDDDAAFIKLLNEGNGKLRIRSDDKYAGKISFSVTPLQRHSPRIKGWAFRITQNPKPGEYRYLRLAWKTTGGRGVMIELAANGGWPSAKSATRRYFSGKNTTKWQARQISEKPPLDWEVITVDLWKDNGEFILTGIAPTALGAEGEALFDSIELLPSLDKP